MYQSTCLCYQWNYGPKARNIWYLSRKAVPVYIRQSWYINVQITRGHLHLIMVGSRGNRLGPALVSQGQTFSCLRCSLLRYQPVFLVTLLPFQPWDYSAPGSDWKTGRSWFYFSILPSKANQGIKKWVGCAGHKAKGKVLQKAGLMGEDTAV